MSPGPAGRFAAALRRRHCWRWPSATIPAAGSTGHWSIPAWPTRPIRSFHEYEGTGSFYTSFSCEPEQTQENLAIVQSVLASVQKDSITEEELHQAQSKMLSRVVRGSERPKGRMMAIGMTLDLPARISLGRRRVEAFEAVTLDVVARCSTAIRWRS